MGTRTQSTREAIDQLNQVEQIVDKSKDLNKKLIEAYAIIFGSEHGKLVLQDMKLKCNYGYTAFATDNARLTDFTLGKQSNIIDILRMINKHKG